MENHNIKRIGFLITIIIVAIIGFSIFTSAQSVNEYPITFQVTEKSTGQPLQYVQLEIWKDSVEYAAAQTQKDGSNSFDLPPGNYIYNAAYRESGWSGIWYQNLNVTGKTTISLQMERI
jgi:hypothetical protein